MKLRTAAAPLFVAGALTLSLAGPAAATTGNSWTISSASGGTTRYYGTWTQSSGSTLSVIGDMSCGGGTVTFTPERQVSGGWTTQAAIRTSCANRGAVTWTNRPAGTYRLRVDFHSNTSAGGYITVN